jgi:inositol-phosphate phosphatase/L-galactose 1-phosphate phosphatase/histidinol-phosphatase
MNEGAEALVAEALLGADIPGSLLKLAVRLADAVRPIVLRHFRAPLAVDHKHDLSPVTLADREAEAVMRSLIAERFPQHGIYGEEMGAKRAGAEYVWVLDPIDGTQSFVTGKPLFGTLIAVLKGGAPILGVIDMPALDERWIGAQGRPTTLNGAPVRARACADLADAWIYATSPHMFGDDELACFERLRRRCRRAVYGAECEAYGLLASGFVDLVCEATMRPYDYLAMVPVVEGAGGRITDWRGRPLSLASSDGRVLASGDAGLHAAALAQLAD